MSRVSPVIQNESFTLPERVVTLSTGTTTLEPAVHSNRLLLVPAGAAAITINLPRATGSGDFYEFLTTAAQTSGSILINATHWDVSNVIVGSVKSYDTSNAVVNVYASTANDIITLDGTNKGGQSAGDYIKMVDAANGTWRIVEAHVTNGGDTPATPFSG